MAIFSTGVKFLPGFQIGETPPEFYYNSVVAFLHFRLKQDMLTNTGELRQQHLSAAIWRESAKMTKYLQLIRGVCSLRVYFYRRSPHIFRCVPFLRTRRGPVQTILTNEKVLVSQSTGLSADRSCRIASGFGVLTPRSAEGGCSHLVSSRTDPGRLSSLNERWLRSLAGEADGIPAPVTPRPCSGAPCSGQPAAPAVPAGLLDGRLNSWAGCARGCRVWP